MHKVAPSISESFNARSTTTEELCNSFIINDYFERLASPNHTIMIGPRGSGKTTLMRMLEVQSLEMWDKENSSFYRKKVDYSGVFIPTDRFWKTQYDRAEAIISHKGNESISLILQSLFTYHILEQICKVVSFRTSRTIERKNNYRSVKIDKSIENELVSALSRLWCLKPEILSLKSLIIELTLKKQSISIYINNVLNGKQELKQPEVVQATIVETISSSIAIINTYFDEIGYKWALLFDELELAPDALIQPLVDAMRGGEKDIIFKLALSPYHKGVAITKTPESAMREQDLSFINLTESSEQDGDRFAKTLCENILLRQGIKTSIEHCFDKPKDIDIDIVFSELATKDPSFKKYLIEKELYNIPYLDQNRYHQNLARKIKFIANLRNSRRKDEKHLKARRRASDLYGGLQNIFRSVEYNPRMLIGIMNIFIPIIKEKGSVSIKQQIECIENYFESFKALLSTIALKSSDKRYNNIYDLVTDIAIFFQNDIHGYEFKAEPKGSIIFKTNADKDLLEAIGYALNAGALIAVKNEVGAFHDVVNIHSTRCRLSYMFSHHFDLLMTLQKEIDFNELIKISNLKGKKFHVIEPTVENPGNQLALDL